MIVAFLGPSLPAREAKGFHLLPPARQGDVWRAIALRPRAIALIDGVFESQPSVWHQEILDALDAGIPVIGGASMGALRAAELHTLGMAGAGRIFRWYRDGTVIDDSEVALLHGGAEHGFRPLTVPQVNVRWSARRWLPPRAATALIDASGSIFYQERTVPRVLELVPLRWRARFRLIDLKAEDARQVLRAARAARGRPVRPREPPPSSFARRRRLLATSSLVRSELADAGLRRALLAGWAREIGLRASAAEIAAARGTIGGEAAADELARLAEEVALERLVLDHAPRMLNDGPSAVEAGLAEQRLRGRQRR
ncbi:MAG TPA: TfuA-like protein [Myxococcales bacterium]|nr:TfuA-like protein [Myxococcales bacterium]